MLFRLVLSLILPCYRLLFDVFPYLGVTESLVQGHIFKLPILTAIFKLNTRKTLPSIKRQDVLRYYLVFQSLLFHYFSLYIEIS